jgi:hypothetical protein
MKTHTFRLGKYRIEFCSRIYGCTDVPGDEDLTMLIQEGNDYAAFSTALHEAMHAEGIPDKYMHTKEGESDTERLARFMWRWVKENIVV